MLLKKIELSMGYEEYRKERLVQGTSKPPILLVTKQQIYQSSPTKRAASRSPVKRSRRHADADGTYTIYVSQESEDILREVFESFCHINEATKTRLIRSQYLIEILASVGFSVTT